ncbi:conserved hypothetical protein [gamma proteobacterium HTCC5015]|nr:conserved hypothetical protein [gamma proteobacterium HTCC5015]
MRPLKDCGDVMQAIKAPLFLVVVMWLSGCSLMSVSDNLSRSMLNHDDPILVENAIPAYLIMLDTLVLGDSDDTDYLLPAAKLYGAYAGSFVDDEVRARKLARRAANYANAALCEELEDLCAVRDARLGEFEAALNEVDDEDDLPVLFTYAAAQASWVQANSGDWNAVASLPKVKAVMQRVLAIDERFDGGMAHLYMGVLETLLPPAMGGRPEQARAHFERALLLSDGNNLMAKVYYAEKYARLIFDRELHDRLLNEVVNAEPRADGFTLSNTLAQEKAKALLASANDYF